MNDFMNDYRCKYGDLWPYFAKKREAADAASEPLKWAGNPINKDLKLW
jgi:hypothetical protein